MAVGLPVAAGAAPAGGTTTQATVVVGSVVSLSAPSGSALVVETNDSGGSHLTVVGQTVTPAGLVLSTRSVVAQVAGDVLHPAYTVQAISNDDPTTTVDLVVATL